MDASENAVEHVQEEIVERAHESTESWILGVALSAAILAVLAAITSLLSEHRANEAMIDQIQVADQWNFYQAKGIKLHLLSTRIELLTALDRPTDKKDLAKLDEYRHDQEKIKAAAEEKQKESESLLQQHVVLSRGVTMYQVAIAIGAISVLTNRRKFWYLALAFGVVGTYFLVAGLLTA